MLRTTAATIKEKLVKANKLEKHSKRPTKFMLSFKCFILSVNFLRFIFHSINVLHLVYISSGISENIYLLKYFKKTSQKFIFKSFLLSNLFNSVHIIVVIFFLRCDRKYVSNFTIVVNKIWAFFVFLCSLPKNSEIKLFCIVMQDFFHAPSISSYQSHASHIKAENFLA